MVPDVTFCCYEMTSGTRYWDTKPWHRTDRWVATLMVRNGEVALVDEEADESLQVSPEESPRWGACAGCRHWKPAQYVTTVGSNSVPVRTAAAVGQCRALPPPWPETFGSDGCGSFDPSPR